MINTNSFPSYVNKIFDLFGDNARLVGGCVRDIVMGRTPKDYDFATTLTPQEMEALKCPYRIIPIGKKHGTMTFVVDGTNVEITTLRVDSSCDGRHANVEFVTDWELDAARRDFTMNAMYIDRNGTLYDYFGGQEDIRLGVIRFVGDASQRLIEDGLRWFRCWRFAIRFDMGMIAWQASDNEIAAKVEASIKNISRERLWSEVKQMLCTDNYDGFFAFLASAIEYYDFFKAAKWDRRTFVEGQPLRNFAAVFKQGYDWKSTFRMSNSEAREVEKFHKIFNAENHHANILDGEYTAEDVVIATGEIINTDGMHKFKITGSLLIAAGIPQGKTVSKILRMMREDWKKHDCYLTPHEIMADWGLPIHFESKVQ